MRGGAVRLRQCDFRPRLYLGRGYPLLVSVLVFFGHALGVEVITLPVGALYTSLSLILTQRARPLIFFVMTAALQISRKNAPGIPYFSSFYFRPPVIAVAVLSGIAFLIACFYYLYSQGLLHTFLLSPLTRALSFFSLGLITGGLFSGAWSLKDFGFSLIISLGFYLTFAFFYTVLTVESAGAQGYLIYAFAQEGVLIFAELLLLYLTVGTDKAALVFGWGIWNTAGVLLAMALPPVMLGAMRRRIYLLPLLALSLGVLLTQSRAALIALLLAYVGWAVICICFNTGRALATILLVLLLLGTCLAACILVRGGYFGSLLDPNGRLMLWRQGLAAFISAPVFGKGFYGTAYDSFLTAHFLPTMAHNTVIQLLSATGIFGLLTYLYYRVCTLRRLFLKPSVTTAMLYLSVFILLGESLVDNYIFWLLPTLGYSVILAFVFSGAEG